MAKRGKNKSVDFKSDTTRRVAYSPSDSGSEYEGYQPQARAGRNFTFNYFFACWVICKFFLSSADFFFKISIFEKFFQEYHQNYIKQFESRPSSTFCEFQP